MAWLNGGGISVITSDAQGVCSLYEFAFDPAPVNGLRKTIFSGLRLS